MAYRINDVECDTAEEVLALKRLTTHKPTTRRTKLDDSTNQNSGAKASWRAARREAKRQGRDDIANVRSEMSAAKKALKS